MSGAVAPQQPKPRNLYLQTRGKFILEAFFGCEVEEDEDEFAKYDYILKVDGEVVGFAEYRRRKLESTKYKTIMLSKHKFLPDNKLPTFFMVEWDDLIGIKKIEMWWGNHAKGFSRTTNLRPGDRHEPVVWLSIPSFETIIKKKPLALA